MSAGLLQDLDADEFSWHVPDRFNIGRACVDDQPPGDLALVADHGGEVRRYCFGDIADTANRLANLLRAHGVRRGDRVAIMAPQGLEVAAAHIACYKSGFVALPMSVHFGPDAQTYRLTHSEAAALVVYGEGYERLAGSLDQLPGLRIVLVSDGAPRSGDSRILPFDEAVASADPGPVCVDTGADDPALLMYTSGTTGRPKGVLHRHQVLLAQLPGYRLSHDLAPQPGDVFWTPADWAWGGGLFDALLPTWLCGRPIVASRLKFSPQWAYELMARHQVRNAFLPPTALKQMMQYGGRPDGVRLRTVASGGEALGESVLTWAAEHLGVTVNEFYGQTECNLLVGNSHQRYPVRRGSMGRAFPGTEVAVLGDDGTPVPDGESGELAVALPHPGALIEYWKDPANTAARTGGDWWRTGDVVTRDADGYLWFGGRSDDIISSGGYRIGPAEIEECLLSHPGVATVAVVGLPHEVRGEIVAAFVVPADGVAPDDTLAKALQDHVKHRLAFYQYPRQIRYLSELPTTTTGKVQRAKLREL
jgi:acetyl-CoA synthetase